MYAYYFNICIQVKRLREFTFIWLLSDNDIKVSFFEFIHNYQVKNSNFETNELLLSWYQYIFQTWTNMSSCPLIKSWRHVFPELNSIDLQHCGGQQCACALRARRECPSSDVSKHRHFLDGRIRLEEKNKHTTVTRYLGLQTIYDQTCLEHYLGATNGTP